MGVSIWHLMCEPLRRMTIVTSDRRSRLPLTGEFNVADLVNWLETESPTGDTAGSPISSSCQSPPASLMCVTWSWAWANFPSVNLCCGARKVGVTVGVT